MISEWEKVRMFRCVQDPQIGPKSKNAFMVPDLPGWEAWYHTASGAVYVKTDTGRRFIVGTGNLSNIELEKETDGKVQDISRARKKANEPQGPTPL